MFQMHRLSRRVGRRNRLGAACHGFAFLLAAGVLLFPTVFPATAQPVNDQFTNRIWLAGAPVSVSGHNVGATRTPGDPTTIGGAICNATVWWSWTASRNG